MRLWQWLKKSGIEAGAGVDAATFAGGRALQKECLEGRRNKRKKKRKKRKRKGDEDDDEDEKDDEEPLNVLKKALRKRGAKQSSALAAWRKRRGQT